MISNRVERTAGVGFGSIYFDWSKCIGRYILLDKFQIQLIPTIPIRQCCREWELICKRYPIRLSLDDPRCRGRWGQKPSHKIVAAPRSKRQRPKKTTTADTVQNLATAAPKLGQSTQKQPADGRPFFNPCNRQRPNSSRQPWILQRPNLVLRPIGSRSNVIPNSCRSFHRTLYS